MIGLELGELKEGIEDGFLLLLKEGHEDGLPLLKEEDEFEVPLLLPRT